MLAGAHKANLPLRGCQAGTYITQIPVSQREIYIGSTPAASHSQVPNSPLITDLNTGGGRRS